MNQILKFLKTDRYSKDLRFLSLVRDLFLTTFIGGIASFLNYIFNFLAANKLPEESFSVFSGVLGFMYLIQIPSVTLQTYFTNLVARDKDFFKKNGFTLLVKRAIIISSLCVLFVLVISPLLASFMEISVEYFLISALMVFGFVYTPVMRGVLLGLKKVDLFNVLGFLEAIFKLIIFLVALNFSSDATWPIIAFASPVLLVGVFAHLVIRKSEQVVNGSNESIGKFFVDVKYLIITMLTLLFYNSPFSLGVMLVNHANRADYAALALLGKIVYFASIMASSVLFTYFSEKASRQEKNRYLMMGVVLNVAISLAIVIIYIFFAETLVLAMFDGKYFEMVPLVAPLALGMVFYSTAFSFVNLFLSDHKSIQIYLLGFATFVQIILYILFNDTLSDAVMNQVITFILIFVFMVGFWAIDEMKHRKLK